ncbi:MAG: radical SAM protein [Anaerolineae bacterium]|nr:radical SAM protein [Anaerolineae bacterium]
MNIVLINVSVRPYMDKAYFPTGLAYVATALKRNGYEFDIIDLEAHRHSDAELAELLGKKSYKVIALGTLVSGYKYAKKVVSIAKRTNPGATIIAGNSVASSIPEHLLTYTEVDIAVKGEGDITIINIMKALEGKTSLSDVKGIVFLDDGHMVDTGYAEIIKDINTIPFPDWDLFDMNLYLSKSIQDVPEPYPIPKEQIKAFVVNTARGCPFGCSFCYHVFQYAKYRYRSPESIIAEVATLQEKYGINYINFFDELTFLSIKQTEAFADALLSSDLKFYWNADIRGNLFTENNLDLLFKLKEGGCQSFGYSLESGNPEILKTMNKKLKVEDFKKQKRALDKAGIKTFTSLVLGYPQETVETLKDTFDVCYELNLYSSAGYLLPQPGTPMFEVAKQKGFADDLESYLMQMGDRQDLRFNMTNIPDHVLEKEVNKYLRRISDKIGLGLTDEQLVKTFSFILSDEDRSNDYQNQ